MSMQDEEIRTVVARLARPHASGGFVIGRAALLAEGMEFAAIMAWIIDHGGTPEAPYVSKSGHGGLHGARQSSNAGGRAPQPEPQYVLPAGALG
jgi:hypothetical protein